MGSTMYDTQGFQRSTANDQFSSLYMTSTQFQSKEEKLPLRKIRDEYKFKNVHQYNIHEDLKRFDRKTLLEMDIMGRLDKGDTQKEKNYADVSHNGAPQPPVDVDQPRDIHIPFRDEGYTRMFTKLNNERRPVYNKKEFNNYMPVDQMDYRISQRMQKRT